MSTQESLRRYWYTLQLEAQAITPETPLVDQVIMATKAHAVADVLVVLGIPGMNNSRDLAKQHLAIVKEKLEIELMHADIDGTLVHARDCDEGRPECSCGAMQEAEARIIELVKSGRLTGFPATRYHEPLADTTARIMATINTNKRNSVVVKRNSAQQIIDHIAQGDGIDCHLCGRPFSEHLRH